MPSPLFMRVSSMLQILPYLKRVWGDAEKQDGSGVNAGLILTHLARGLAEVKLTHLR